YVLGATGGASRIALSRPQGPPHSHDLMATAITAYKKGPAGNVLARPDVAGQTKSIAGKLYNANPLDTKLNAPISAIGNGEPHDNLQPFLVLNYCICIIGIVPPRGGGANHVRAFPGPDRDFRLRLRAAPMGAMQRPASVDYPEP